ncbi:MAG: DUF2202 domain-containing protein [Arcobacter sp.]|nr:DUF2202 domain-containing protein [Arcobacter sp.]
MEKLNIDQDILESRRIDVNSDIPILSQALRICAYDEFRAYNTYSNVINKFGNVRPFSNIIEAEIRHYEHTLVLLQKYGIEEPFVKEEQIELPNTLQECCELGIAGEIRNIAMYEHLLSYVQEDDVRDLFYRLQAASYNNHLPAFRSCVMRYYSNDTASNNMLNDLSQYQELMEEVMSGNIDQNKLMSILGNMNLSLIGGLALGALGGISLNSLINQEEQEK